MLQLSQLNGIPSLLKLLDSDSGEVQQAATAALRNVIYENNENKMEVKDHEGVGVFLHLLRTNRDIETRRQLTGNTPVFIHYSKRVYKTTGL